MPQPGGSWGDKEFSWGFNASYTNCVEAKVGDYQPCSGPAQARAEAASSTWRTLCLPRAPSPGNPSAAAVETTEMFVFMCYTRCEQCWGKGCKRGGSEAHWFERG